jgi:spoIIIJ-associated protein
VEWVETTGRTVAEALDRALDQLGVDEQEAEVEVVDEPQKGLFGRLRVEARVRARVRPATPRPKAERRDRRRRGEGGGRDRERDRRGRGGSGAKGRGRGGPGSSRNGDGRDRDRGRDGRDGGDAAGNEAARVGAGGAEGSAVDGGSGDQAVATRTATGSGASTAGGGSESGNVRKRRRRRRSGSANTQGAVVANTNQASTDELRPTLDLDEQRAAVEEFLTGLVGAFGRPEATVSVEAAEDDNTLEAEVNGEELGLLVGPKGATLQAVHELVRSMVQRRFVGQAHARVRVDVAGYRQRRREALERFTRTVADEVLSTGRAKVLDPMMASDRKVVHDVANEIDGVRTMSEGEEPSRRVIIQPA